MSDSSIDIWTLIHLLTGVLTYWVGITYYPSTCNFNKLLFLVLAHQGWEYIENTQFFMDFWNSSSVKDFFDHTIFSYDTYEGDTAQNSIVDTAAFTAGCGLVEMYHQYNSKNQYI